MTFSPDGRRLATPDNDPLTIALWDLHTGQKTFCPGLTGKGNSWPRISARTADPGRGDRQRDPNRLHLEWHNRRESRHFFGPSGQRW